MTSRPFATPMHKTLGASLHTRVRSLQVPRQRSSRPFATPLARTLHQPLHRRLQQRPGDQA